MARRETRRTEELAACSVLVAASTPAELHALLEVVRNARALAVGARTLEAALMVFGYERIDLLLVTEGFDRGRAVDLAKAAPPCARVLVSHVPRELRAAEAAWFRRIVSSPVFVAEVEAIVAAVTERHR